jgi:agmatinase
MTTFLGVPSSSITDLHPQAIALLGVLNATPYEAGKPSHSQDAPAAIRAASEKFSNWLDHFDFDTGHELRGRGKATLHDIGDIAGDPQAPSANREAIRKAVATILHSGATPVVLGGDDSVPIPVLQAYEKDGPIWVVQIDAHIDWREERFGERMGWSSPMRRASEMAWVEGIVQIGARGVGSALRQDLEDAERWGARIVTARQVFEDGIAPVLRNIPQNARVVISLDCDGLDPAIMPGVMAQVPGGLTYWHMVELFEGLAERTRIVGMDIVELAPQRDVGNISALTAARLVMNAIAAIEKSSG